MSWVIARRKEHGSKIECRLHDVTFPVFPLSNTSDVLISSKQKLSYVVLKYQFFSNSANEAERRFETYNIPH